MSKTQGVETGKRPRRKAPPPTAADEEPWQRSPWRLVRGGAALYRSYAFPTPALAASFSQLAVGLAAYAGLPLFVRQVDASVTLALRGEGSRKVGPLTAELFDRLASLS